MTKYLPLERHLRSLDLDRTTLSFSQVEAILGSPLPASSSKYEAHWRGTTPGRPGGAIAVAGWRVERIEWLTGTLTLSRNHNRAQPTRTTDHTHVQPTASSRWPAPEARPWQTLETQAASYFSQLWNTDLEPRIVSVSGVSKSFDLVSSDARFVGDAKQYKNIRTPAAKWQGIAEYVWLLQHVEAEHRFLVFGGDALVAERFLARWRPLVAPVAFYHLTDDGHRVL